MKRALRYSIILCIVSWLFFALIYYVGNVRSVTNPLYIPIASVYMLLPMICALTMERFEGRGERRTLNLVSFKMNWYWLIALLLPILITLIVVAIDIWLLRLGYKTEPIVPQSVLDSLGSDKLQQILSNRTNLALLVLLESLIAGSTINALFAFGEEYGWRKYLVESLQDRGFMEVALFIGGVWGIWHLPMILIGHNYAEHNIAGIFMMILFCMSLGVLELYVVVKCRSVVAAAVLHGTINAAATTERHFTTTYSSKTPNDIQNSIIINMPAILCSA